MKIEDIREQMKKYADIPGEYGSLLYEVRFLLAEVDRLIADNEAKEKALRAVEWHDYAFRCADEDNYMPVNICPICKMSRQEEHKPDCIVGQALGKEADGNG